MQHTLQRHRPGLLHVFRETPSMRQRPFTPRRLAVAMRVQILRALLYGKCDPHRALVVAGSPRSGTTWIAQALSGLPGSAVLFEPLHLDAVPEARAAGFSWRTHVTDVADWASGEAFLRRVFRGDILNQWTVREISLRSALTAEFLIVKFVRANRMLGWIARTFPIRAPLLVLRHPCAVVASRIRKGDWRHVARPEVPHGLTIAAELQTAIDRLETVEERLAADWALDSYLLLSSPTPHPWQLVFYEHLVLDFRKEIEKVCHHWQLDVPARIEVRAQTRSSVTHRSGISGVAGWRQQLSGDQIRRILDVTAAFGLDFYTERLEPDMDRVHRGVVQKRDAQRNKVQSVCGIRDDTRVGSALL